MSNVRPQVKYQGSHEEVRRSIRGPSLQCAGPGVMESSRVEALNHHPAMQATV
jgi:hypothetical protein